MSENDSGVEPATPAQIGQRLRDRRKDLGLTLKDVAEQAGLTTGFISQIERGITSPSLSSLANVAKVMDLAMRDLFPQPDPGPGPLTRAGDRPRFEFDPASIQYERVSSSFEGVVLRSVVVHEPPGYHHRPIRHEGEELFYMLAGSITIELDGDRHVLGPGDTLHFDSRRSHQSWNHTTQTATYLHTCTMDVFGDRSPHAADGADNHRETDT